ncbi:MAG: DUF6622 family protein [Mesorhizobium sp.]
MTLSLRKPAVLLLAAVLTLTLSSGAFAADADSHGPGVIDILSHTPLWVWPLILYGVFIGWTRTRDRVVSPSRLFVMPVIIAGLALHNLASSGMSAAGLLGFVCGAIAGTLAGIAVARRRPARLLADGKLALPGDWLPLVIIVAIIVIRYAEGVAVGIDPALAQETGFVLASAILSGFLAAMMVARSIGVLPQGFFRATARQSS